METLLDVGLGNAAMAAAMAAVAAVLGRATRRPALAHGLWLIVLAKLLTPPLWTIDLGAATGEPAALATVAATSEEISAASEAGAFEIDGPTTVETASVSASGPGWRTAAVWAWLAGSATWAASAAIRIVRFRRALGGATPAPPDIQEAADALAIQFGLRAAPGVWMMPGVISPALWAMGGPARLLLPSDLWETLGDAGRSTVLAHELAHFRRRDHWVRQVELAATALYWWCPVVWWARRELHAAEEECCDAWVVWACPGSARAYATALLDTVDFLADARPAVPLAASGAGQVHHLKRRLTMILSGLTPRTLSIAGRAAVVGLAALILPLTPGFAGDEPRPARPIAEARNDPGPPSVLVNVVSDEPRDEPRDEPDEPRAEARDPIRAEAERARAASGRAEAARAKVRAEAEVTRARVQGRIGPDGRPIGAKPSREDAEAVEKAQAELREAQVALTRAAKKLAEAQMKAHGLPGTINTPQFHYEFRESVGPREEGRREEKDVIIMRRGDKAGDEAATLPGNGNGDVRVFRFNRADGPVPPSPPRAARRANEQDDRIKDLEKKLDALIGEMKELKAKK